MIANEAAQEQVPLTAESLSKGRIACLERLVQEAKNRRCRLCAILPRKIAGDAVHSIIRLYELGK